MNQSTQLLLAQRAVVVPKPEPGRDHWSKRVRITIDVSNTVSLSTLALQIYNANYAIRTQGDSL